MLATQLTSLRFDEMPPNHAGHVAFYYRDVMENNRGRGYFWVDGVHPKDLVVEYARITLFGGDLR